MNRHRSSSRPTLDPTLLEQVAPEESAGAREPLWSQVKSAILAIIRENPLQPHDALPSEHQLCERFGVSRTVVREAMNQLVYEHVIYKRQGKGAFVAGAHDAQDFVGSVVGFSGELLEKHRVVTRRVLIQRVIEPNARVRHHLKLPTGNTAASRVVEIQRVQLVDGVPRLLVTHYLPEALVPGLEQVPLQIRSLYDVLQRRYGLVFKQADRWLEAVTASAEQCQLLEVSRATPLLAIESCAYAEGGRPIEHYQALYRTDQASLHICVGAR